MANIFKGMAGVGSDIKAELLWSNNNIGSYLDLIFKRSNHEKA